MISPSQKKALPNQNCISKHFFRQKPSFAVIICPPKTKTPCLRPPVTKTVFFGDLQRPSDEAKRKENEKKMLDYLNRVVTEVPVDGWRMDGLQVELSTDVPKDPLVSPKKGISLNQSRDGIHPCKVLNRDLVHWAWRSRLVSRHIWLMMWWNLDETHMISFIQTNPIGTPCVAFCFMGSLP